MLKMQIVSHDSLANSMASILRAYNFTGCISCNFSRCMYSSDTESLKKAKMYLLTRYEVRVGLKIIINLSSFYNSGQFKLNLHVTTARKSI